MADKKQVKSKSITKDLLAGGIAGGIEATIMFPTEFVKTQVNFYFFYFKSYK
jgi:hypothetical protein